jgi:hypothetical protein
MSIKMWVARMTTSMVWEPVQVVIVKGADPDGRVYCRLPPTGYDLLADGKGLVIEVKADELFGKQLLAALECLRLNRKAADSYLSQVDKMVALVGNLADPPKKVRG